MDMCSVPGEVQRRQLVALAGQRPDARVRHVLAAAQAEGAQRGAQRRDVQQRVVACDTGTED